MLNLGKFIPPKGFVYSFIKNLYGIHQFTVNGNNVYYNQQIVNIPLNIARGVFTQESVIFPQAFNVDIVVLAPFEIEVNAEKIQGYNFVQLGSQTAISVKGLGQVFIWLYQPFTFPSYLPFQYILNNDYAYDAYLHTLGLHEAVIQYLNNGKEIPDTFFEESGINEVLYYLKYGCVRNKEKFALGVVILQILFPYNPFNLPYGNSYGQTYQNALQISTCYGELAKEISEIESELIQDSEYLQSQINELSENLIQTSENLQTQINGLQNEITSEEEQIQTLFNDYYQVSECCYNLADNVIIELAQVVQCLTNIVLGILAGLPPGIAQKIIANLTACPLGSEIQVLTNELSESSENVVNLIETVGHGLGHKLHKVGRKLGHLLGNPDPFSNVTDELLSVLENLLNESANVSYSSTESNNSNSTDPNSSNSTSESTSNNSSESTSNNSNTSEAGGSTSNSSSESNVSQTSENSGSSSQYPGNSGNGNSGGVK